VFDENSENVKNPVFDRHSQRLMERFLPSLPQMFNGPQRHGSGRVSFAVGRGRYFHAYLPLDAKLRSPIVELGSVSR
jgi:hypothetical protein